MPLYVITIGQTKSACINRKIIITSDFYLLTFSKVVHQAAVEGLELGVLKRYFSTLKFYFYLKIRKKNVLRVT